jgi:hypothetical protein
MSTVAGVFSETQLRTLRAMADEIMFDDRIKQQFIPQIGIVDGLKKVQTAAVNPKFSQLKDSSGMPKRTDVEVIWENACDLEAAECTTCTLDGTKLSTNAQTYSLEFCREVQFAVSEADYIDNEFDANLSIAKGLLRADKQLAEAYAAYTVSVLEANKGVNLLTTGKGCVSGSDTYIAAAYWDAQLMAYFSRVAIMNRFTTPTLISGANLYEAVWAAQMNRANDNGAGAANMFGVFPIFFDMFNIDTVNSPNLVTYLLSQNSVALANRAYNPSTPEIYGASKRWKVPSKFIPGFEYDIFYAASCDNDFVEHQFKVKLLADLFVNPEGCEADNSGILAFICGACPT